MSTTRKPSLISVRQEGRVYKTSRGVYARMTERYRPLPRKSQPISRPPPLSFPDPPPESTPSSKTPNDYLREWLPRRHEYLDVLLEGEAPPSSGRCMDCLDNAGSWRCLDCLGRPFLCKDCCRTTHKQHPLHRIEKWTGSCFGQASLWQLGIIVHLEHLAAPCPSGFRFNCSSNSASEGESISDLVAEGLEDEDEIKSNVPTHIKGNPVLTVVDISGVHHLAFRFCRCPGHAKDDIQLLRSGFVVTSYQRICTVFTTRVLNDFLLNNQECNTAALNYFEKLRRTTSSAFPHTVKNRYPELLRLSRIWRSLKSWKWNGFGYSEKEPVEGELALFCPACPQPGINLPAGWEKEQDQNPLLYMRSFVLDGNFVANHLKQKRPEDDVSLSEGTGIMARREPYHQHLAFVGDRERKQKNDCNATRALNVKVRNAGKDATGIGATACARHGFFCPGSCVDFQNGERQANIDYSLSQGLNMTHVLGLSLALVIYDAMCRSGPNLLERFAENPHLSIPAGLNIHKAVGSFHIHSHVQECYQRYGLLYMPGAGLVDGEILETLWSVLNNISPCTRGASIAHRDEILNDHMNYSNWKKMTKIGKTLLRKHTKAVALLEEFELALSSLGGSATEEQIQRWNSNAEAVQRRRADDVKAMDWFALKRVKDPHRAEVQLRLSSASDATGRTQEAADVVSEGLHIQESQIALQQFVWKLGKRQTTKQRLELRQKRSELSRKIERFHSQVLALIGVPDSSDLWVDIPDEIGDKWLAMEPVVNHDGNVILLEVDQPSTGPERAKILLPSRLGKKKCDTYGINDLRKAEIALRCGQANEALENLRLEVGKRAFLYLDKRKRPGSKEQKTRSWAEIQSTSSVIRRWSQIYRKARDALVRLKPGVRVLEKYKMLLDKDLQLSTILLDVSIPGNSHASLPWIWNSGHIQTGQGSNVMDEFLRVHWLRAQAQRDRAREEKLLVEHEMRWTINYFTQRAQKWSDLKGYSKYKSPGHRAYACRQRNMWRALAHDARDLFKGVLE